MSVHRTGPRQPKPTHMPRGFHLFSWKTEVKNEPRNYSSSRSGELQPSDERLWERPNPLFRPRVSLSFQPREPFVFFRPSPEKAGRGRSPLPFFLHALLLWWWFYIRFLFSFSEPVRLVPCQWSLVRAPFRFQCNDAADGGRAGSGQPVARCFPESKTWKLFPATGIHPLPCTHVTLTRRTTTVFPSQRGGGVRETQDTDFFV
jgi:hypothetical protein